MIELEAAVLRKSPLPPYVEAVYMLYCRNCTADYVGETGRAFSSCINEYESACRHQNNSRSSFARHFLEYEYTVGEKNSAPFHCYGFLVRTVSGWGQW